MSLVNDMLRDLDQRRKETSGSSASVKLTPAPEIVHEASKKPIILYFVVAIVIGAGAVAWFWSQQDGSNSTRQLNIAPQIVNQPNPVVPDEDVIDNISAIQDEPAAQNQTSTGEDQQEDQTIARSEPTESNPSSGNASVSLSNSVNDESVEENTSTSEFTEESVQVVQVDDQNVDGRGERNELNSTNSPSIEQIEQAEIDAALVDLADSPDQEVKNTAALSAEDYDLLAVQEALGLIAENKRGAAYEVLERHIIDNQYANQSRETYAKLLIQEQNLLGAYELIEAGLALSPNHSGFKKIKARILIADGQLDAAVDLLLSRAPAVDDDLEYHDILATAQLATRDYEGALISYT